MATPLRPIFASQLLNLQRFGVHHGFFTRQGGVSDGIFNSLNVGLGSNDNRDNILKNRERITNFFHLKPQNLVTPYQIHSNKVHIIDSSNIAKQLEGDGLITLEKGIAIGILTADCGPILFADPNKKIIACAHAGWRGALNGIIENTIQNMEKLGSKRANIIAILGPCIGPKNYEINEEFRQNFLEERTTNTKFFVGTSSPTHYLFNLWAFILERLKEAGVQAECVEMCTYEDETRFYSYRRKTHRNESDYGRQMSVIMLENYL
ncbi:peptidoglycan editing factor PgeF [Bartonella tamiae]|uniref:Purine nucleoside phosphorylase n=1 Tax=Bartonella tamiae Th239 TaxID=1094558 RepID=J0QTG5_9HYPH|nr:peptidoglycan editing factor PgeF [Bartonella tamiae]EJF89186.1 hypothetical protein ME5_01737 [Bartonella tamiae Th239]EJF95411.1 hypothetical protein MEG_00144 [Bartonella tamiae Th307]